MRVVQVTLQVIDERRQQVDELAVDCHAQAQIEPVVIIRLDIRTPIASERESVRILRIDENVPAVALERRYRLEHERQPSRGVLLCLRQNGLDSFEVLAFRFEIARDLEQTVAVHASYARHTGGQ